VSFTAYLSPHALRSTGKNDWRPFEQAAHLYRMWEKGGYSEARLAEFFRQSKTSISAKIRAYRLMAEKYVPEYKDANVMGKWSYFEEFYKNCKPKANDPDGIELENKFVDWVGTGKFSRGEKSASYRKS